MTGAGILLYHRVSAVGSEPGGPSVAPADFHAHMAHLQDGYHPVSLDDLVRGLGIGALPERAVAVTLDDGYLDALETASPILAQLGVPATFFCTTDRLDDEHELWWDTLERILIGGAVRDALELTVAGVRRRFDTGSVDARRDALAALGEVLRGASLEDRDRLVAALERWGGGPFAPRASHRALTGAEIQRLARRPGHAVGAHSANHLALPAQLPHVREREAAACRERLEALLQREVPAFAYPYGAYDAATVEAVRGAGFRAALTVEEGLCRPGVDLMRLPRVEIRSGGKGAFAARLRALFSGTSSS